MTKRLDRDDYAMLIGWRALSRGGRRESPLTATDLARHTRRTTVLPPPRNLGRDVQDLKRQLADPNFNSLAAHEAERHKLHEHAHRRCPVCNRRVYEHANNLLVQHLERSRVNGWLFPTDERETMQGFDTRLNAALGRR